MATSNENMLLSEETISFTESFGSSADHEPPKPWKDEVYILVLGHTGVGKSSLINALIGTEVAEVTDSVTSTQLKPVECHQLVIDGKRIYIYDTRGFGDREIEEDRILGKIKNKQSSFHLVLFCHKLYDKVDISTEEEMQLLAREMGNELLEHTIFVFTFGDEYKVRSPEYRKKRQIPDAQERIQRKMKERAEELTDELRKSLATVTKDASVINNIPYCIVSGVQTKLPTSHNWTDDLWKLCEERSSEEAQPFMTWYKMNRDKMDSIFAGGLGGMVFVGVAAGATIGVVGGTVGFPGLGTIAGAAVGAVGGGVAGIIGGGLLGATAGGIVNKTIENKKQSDEMSQGIG